MNLADRVAALTMLIATLAVLPDFARAESLELGAPYGVVRAAFTDAHESVDGRGRVLEVPAPRFAGVVWRKADFAFDPTNHLTSVTLSMTQASFVEIENLMANALAAADAAPQGEEGLAQDREGDVRIRICQAEDGAITVTFERTAI